jgi:16S rRNA (cytosine967-C5)-methyltransferase
VLGPTALDPTDRSLVSEGSSNGVSARRIAIEALERIEKDGAYANLLLPKLLAESNLDERDRGFVTELVYGSTRMKRALDYLVDRFIDRDDVDSRVRAALRVGAYQLEFMRVPAHAAVDATVAATPKRGRGFVNAVLRKVSNASVDETAWPTEGIRLSYPDWILDRLAADLGERSTAVLEAMNVAASVHTRDDGYRQDPASQAVAALVEPEGLVLDLCAAPGGKATYIAGPAGGGGATVIGSDLHEHRAGLVRTAAIDTATRVHPVVADATSSPFRRHVADAVLIDAPCSGLGSLRRRTDARWRIKATDVDVLAELQFSLVKEAAGLVRPGGHVVFSVCTLTTSESTDVDARIALELPELQPMPLPSVWEPFGRGGRLLPDVFAGDGMAAFSYRLSS